MSVDIHARAADLLEKIANSVYDRNKQNDSPLIFSVKEIQVVETFLKEIINDAFKQAGEY